MVLYLLFRDRKSQESTCISKPERFYNQLARLLAKRGKKDFSMKIQVIQPALLYLHLLPRIFHEVWRLWSPGLSSNGASRTSYDRTRKPGKFILNRMLKDLDLVSQYLGHHDASHFGTFGSQGVGSFGFAPNYEYRYLC